MVSGAAPARLEDKLQGLLRASDAILRSIFRLDEQDTYRAVAYWLQHLLDAESGALFLLSQGRPDKIELVAQYALGRGHEFSPVSLDLHSLPGGGVTGWAGNLARHCPAARGQSGVQGGFQGEVVLLRAVAPPEHTANTEESRYPGRRGETMSLVSAPPAVKRILLVEDKPPIALLLRNELSDRYDVGEAGDQSTALNRLEEGWDALVIDLKIPRGPGLEANRDEGLRLIEAIRQRGMDTPILAMVSGPFLTRELKERLDQLGVHRAYEKPFILKDFSEDVDSLLAPRR